MTDKLVQLVLARKVGAEDDAFRKAAMSEFSALQGKLPAGSSRFLAFALPAQNRSPIASFDAVIGVRWGDEHDFDAVAAAFRGLSSRLDGHIDAARSTALAGTEHVIVPGEGEVYRFFAVRRLPGMSKPDFHDYWLHTHGQFALRMPNAVPYRQFHASADQSTTLATIAGLSATDFEGFAETYFESADAVAKFFTAAGSPEQKAAMEDIAKFIDTSRSASLLTQIAARA